MRSSYSENDYGPLFSFLVKLYKPKLIVELGVLDGYSLSYMATAGDSTEKIIGIDLWEQYPHKHSNFKDIKRKFVYHKNVELWDIDAFEAYQKFEDNSIDLLHVDISNDGDKLTNIFELWRNKLSEKAIVIIEGGSEDRDNVEWMKTYNKKSIRDFLENFNPETEEVFTFDPYPSLTIIRKK